MVARLTVILFALFIPSLLQGQSYTTINYTVNEGLASNEVYEVFQDRNGFLWFGTDNGVVKYDGYELLRIGVEDGLTDPVVFGFHEDYKGRMWFRTFSGKLCYYENNKIVEYEFNKKLLEFTAQSVISAIYLDTLDQLWFSTYRHEGVFGKINKLGEAETNTAGTSVLYYQDVGKDGMLYGYQQQDLDSILVNGKSIAIGSLENCGLFQVVAIKWRNRLLLSACNKIFEYDGETMRVSYNSEAIIISLSIDRNDNLWVGYVGKGADKFTSPDFSQTQKSEFIPSNVSVTRVFEDNHRGLWFSTLEQGVFHVPNVNIENYSLPDRSRVRVVTASDDVMYIGSYEGNVWMVLPGQQLMWMKHFPPPLRSLFIDSDKNVWVTSARKSFCFDSSFVQSADYPYTLAYSAENKDGKIYSVSGGALLATIDHKKGKTETKHLPFMCRSVFIHDTTVFIGKRNGLYITDLDISNLREIPELSEYKINKILKVNDSTLLITTIGRGMIIFNTLTHAFRNFNTQNKFVANNIYAALRHDLYFWFGTESGLVKVKINSVFQDELLFDVLTKEDGLISTQITNLAFYDDHIWAFSDYGYSLVHEQADQATQQVPRFYLKHARVNNQEIDNEEKVIELAFNENNIDIQFGFISFDKAKIFIRHRLQEQEQWNYTMQKFVQPYSLAAGEYQVQIEYSFDNTHWHTGYKSPLLVIKPALWKTWYFQLMVVLLVLSLIYIFFRYQLRIYRIHQQKLIQSQLETIEKERARIAKDLHDSVGTDFSAIKMTVNQLLKKHNEPHADEVETHFQNTIQEIKTIIYGLSPPGLERYGLMTGLKNYAEKINGKVPVRIDVNTFGKEIKDPALSISVFRIIQELISNTLKHANAKNISIHINAFDDLLNVVYEDNGKGFMWDDNNRGAGLYNIESRVQSVEGQLKFQSTEYGVSYTIDIPLKS